MPLQGIAAHQTFLYRVKHNALEIMVHFVRTLSLAVCPEEFSEFQDKFRGYGFHVQECVILAVSRCFFEKPDETVVSLDNRFTDIVSEPLRFTFFLEIGEEICLSVLLQPVSGTVFKKRLLTFKTYFLGKCQSVFILYSFLLVFDEARYRDSDFLFGGHA